ncbi:AAA family ATPase [bacterium]|nr:AAA family ATPase [bacterium]
MNIYITGINKNSGKTVVAAGISAVMQSLGYKACVYKPIQTGALDKGKYLLSPDLTFVKMLDPYITTHSTYMMTNKATPEVSAEAEKIKISISNIKRDYSELSKSNETIVVEAPSSLMTPIADNLFAYDIPLGLKIPIVVVVTPSNDNIGQYLAEINAAKSFGLDISGVIINKYPAYSESLEVKSFPSLIEKYSDVKVLGLIRNFKGNSVSISSLITEIINGIDVQDVFKMKIPKLNMF